MSYLVASSILLLCTVGYVCLFTGRRERGLPPGPKTLPFIGNLHQLPTSRPQLQLTKWAQQYGGIYSLKLGSSTTIVLTSRHYVKELVDKRSSIYSSRPPSYVGDLMTEGDHLLLTPYGAKWRTQRKFVHQFFMESEVEGKYLGVVEAEAGLLVRELWEEGRGEGVMRAPKRFSNSIIMSLIYGIRTPHWTTPHMTKLYALMEHWSEVMSVGGSPPVEAFPFLHHLPERLLGNWKSRANSVRAEMNALYSSLLTHVVERRRKSGSVGCFMDQILDREKEWSRHELYFIAGSVMEGGSDTSSSIILAFVHAMTRWPAVLRAAQKEMDEVVGEGRTPVWSDYSRLPYVAACVKETMRWRPVVALSFPHLMTADKDDEIDGYKIPKGSAVVINVYGIHRDPTRFPDPEVFDPDRWRGVTKLASELASASIEERDHYGYGAGRRICPGMHLAERNLWIAIAKIIWGCNISTVGQKPEDVDVSSEKAYSAGFLVCADDFPCEVTCRSGERRKTLEREMKTAERDVFQRFDSPSDGRGPHGTGH
ncbi:cytochrome P450 [Aulographum hederae CBS 113979]|uniref:Cytochrome P450 n=1 Tax=Aulographum hederae CBS 113979 TaxID=1176131 RepID=A0A6G1HEF5_9PEZI|nr:cytochrome P450 [Aulographum hederae CBS 113979]